MFSIFAPDSYVLDFYSYPFQCMIAGKKQFFNKAMTEDFRDMPDMLYYAEVHTILNNFIPKAKLNKPHCILPVPSVYGRDRLIKGISSNDLFQDIFLIDNLKCVAFDIGLFNEDVESLFTRRILIFITERSVFVGVLFYKHVISIIAEKRFVSFPEWSDIEPMVDKVKHHIVKRNIISDNGLPQDEFNALIGHGLERPYDKVLHVAVDPYHPGRIHNAPANILRYYDIDQRSVLRGAVEAVNHYNVTPHKSSSVASAESDSQHNISQVASDINLHSGPRNNISAQ